MDFVYNDGGRKDAGFKGFERDCVTRAIAIVTGKPYRQIWSQLNDLCIRHRRLGHPESGIKLQSLHFKRYMQLVHGFIWHPCMKPGSGCQVHLTQGELPNGKLIVRVSKHLVAVIDQVIHDNRDPRREIPQEDGSIRRRCVYGYWLLTS